METVKEILNYKGEIIVSEKIDSDSYLLELCNGKYLVTVETGIDVSFGRGMDPHNEDRFENDEIKSVYSVKNFEGDDVELTKEQLNLLMSRFHGLSIYDNEVQ